MAEHGRTRPALRPNCLYPHRQFGCAEIKANSKTLRREQKSHSPTARPALSGRFTWLVAVSGRERAPLN